MIVELHRDDFSLIKELEESLSTFFLSNTKIIDDFNNNTFTKYFIFRLNNNIIGIVNYYDLYDRFEIANIYVLPEYRNQKIGSQLIEKVIEEGNIKKIQNITLEVKIDNYNAIKLYTKYNFKKVAIREKYYNGIDGILMERKMI